MQLKYAHPGFQRSATLLHLLEQSVDDVAWTRGLPAYPFQGLKVASITGVLRWVECRQHLRESQLEDL